VRPQQGVLSWATVDSKSIQSSARRLTEYLLAHIRSEPLAQSAILKHLHDALGGLIKRGTSAAWDDVRARL
jgi:hypothetical protein